MLLLQADQTVEKDPFADLEEISDLGTGDTTADEAGPSSLPLKENLQPATERISAHTRGGQQRRPDLCPDLLNTRTIAEPSLKGQLSGSAFEGRLRSAAPKEGTQPEAFYGLGRGASTQQLREDSPAPPRRQSTRGQKRKAEQVLYFLSPPSRLAGRNTVTAEVGCFSQSAKTFDSLAAVRSRIYWLRRATSPSPWTTQKRRRAQWELTRHRQPRAAPPAAPPTRALPTPSR